MYLMRLDDACPNWDRQKWQHMKDFLDAYAVKPLVAVIPDNRMEKLLHYPVDHKYLDFIDECCAHGWEFALHGFNHVLSSMSGGINPVNKRSEFAGVPLAEQKRKIAWGYAALLKQGITPKCFIAPAHTYDINTLEALRSETDIRIISDTVATDIYYRRGFHFIPQQCGMVRKMPFALTTFCYHPNNTDETQFKKLENFLAQESQNFTSFKELKFTERKLSLADMILQNMYFTYRKARSIIS